MIKWRVKIKGIRTLLTEDDSVDEAKRVGKEIYKILTSNLYKSYFRNFESQTTRELEEFNQIVDCEDLNGLLNDLYDYCDANLIWIDLDE